MLTRLLNVSAMLTRLLNVSAMLTRLLCYYSYLALGLYIVAHIGIIAALVVVE